MMFTWKVFVSLTLVAGLLSSVEGKNKFINSSRIVGGYETDISHYPFMVSIQKLKSGRWKHVCGGSILTPSTVLTAGHCLVGKDPQYYRVVAGVTDWRMADSGQWRRPARFDIHPAYVRVHGIPGLFNDVAVAVLAAPFRFNRLLRPLRFPPGSTDQAMAGLLWIQRNHTICMSPGWGKTTNGTHQPASNRLKVTPATLQTSEECADSICRINNKRCGIDFDRLQQICASSPAGTVCNGDSGGPLVCNGFVVGVVSWNIACIRNWPSLYTGLGLLLEIPRMYEYLPLLERNEKPAGFQ